MAKYRLKTGIDYLGKRAEAGEIVSDLPPKAIKWLVECDAIVLADGSSQDPVVEEAETDPTPTASEGDE